MSSNDSVPPGIVCTPTEYALSREDPHSLYCLTRNETIGLTVKSFDSSYRHHLTRNYQIVSQAGLLSLVALSYVFAIILVRLYPAANSLRLTIYEQRNLTWRIRHLVTNRLHVSHEPMDLLMARI